MAGSNPSRASDPEHQHWDVDSIPDMTGKVVVITGSNCGLGLEAAKGLSSKGASVVMACRTVSKAEAARQGILEEVPNADLTVMELDLASMHSVRAFSRAFHAQYQRLDVLINNAGLMVPPYQETADGWESQMGTNHLGHFALTGRLLDLLRATPHSSQDTAIVSNGPPVAIPVHVPSRKMQELLGWYYNIDTRPDGQKHTTQSHPRNQSMESLPDPDTDGTVSSHAVYRLVDWPSRAHMRRFILGGFTFREDSGWYVKRGNTSHLLWPLVSTYVGGAQGASEEKASTQAADRYGTLIQAKDKQIRDLLTKLETHGQAQRDLQVQLEEQKSHSVQLEARLRSVTESSSLRHSEDVKRHQQYQLLSAGMKTAKEAAELRHIQAVSGQEQARLGALVEELSRVKANSKEEIGRLGRERARAQVEKQQADLIIQGHEAQIKHLKETLGKERGERAGVDRERRLLSSRVNLYRQALSEVSQHANMEHVVQDVARHYNIKVALPGVSCNLLVGLDTAEGETQTPPTRVKHIVVQTEETPKETPPVLVEAGIQTDQKAGGDVTLGESHVAVKVGTGSSERESGGEGGVGPSAPQAKRIQAPNVSHTDTASGTTHTDTSTGPNPNMPTMQSQAPSTDTPGGHVESGEPSTDFSSILQSALGANPLEEWPLDAVVQWADAVYDQLLDYRTPLPKLVWLRGVHQRLVGSHQRNQFDRAQSKEYLRAEYDWLPAELKRLKDLRFLGSFKVVLEEQRDYCMAYIQARHSVLETLLRRVPPVPS
ncbi:short-chain dehydrogenase/reductase SDR [Kipferlia bialata]|uniref:Short-chain dehydrogenase/reductase SDR n=1 Tax=Kipferlia bialata TaxID=797122 RepID=A0A9K3CTZ9_9EUKA|nr:short-chain dehydrogenase/reductase SDR [Kipferlia bialata]|eukprot:g3624.t1